MCVKKPEKGSKGTEICDASLTRVFLAPKHLDFRVAVVVDRVGARHRELEPGGVLHGVEGGQDGLDPRRQGVAHGHDAVGGDECDGEVGVDAEVSWTEKSLNCLCFLGQVW